jgi:hypothetical protein
VRGHARNKTPDVAALSRATFAVLDGTTDQVEMGRAHPVIGSYPHGSILYNVTTGYDDGEWISFLRFFRHEIQYH